VLHIGAMKTGTSYIQKVLAANRDALCEQGVLFACEKWSQQVSAVEQLMALRRKPGGPLDKWNALVDEVNGYSGRVAVISMEFLSFAGPELARRAVSAFAPNRVTVVMTLRDLARVLPAQWQELTQNGIDWTFTQYLDGASQRKPSDSAQGRHFWYRQRWPRSLRAWQPLVAPDDLVVVTVPQPGAPQQLLMQRMAQAMGFDANVLDLEVFGNDSLGGVSAELMRRVTHEALGRGFNLRQMTVLKFDLAKFTLSRRRADEPTIVTPLRLKPWVERVTQELIDGVQTLQPRVIGDLAELAPSWPDRTGRWVTEEPETLPADLVLDAALDGVLALTQAHSRIASYQVPVSR